MSWFVLSYFMEPNLFKALNPRYKFPALSIPSKITRLNIVNIENRIFNQVLLGIKITQKITNWITHLPNDLSNHLPKKYINNCNKILLTLLTALLSNKKNSLGLLLTLGFFLLTGRQSYKAEQLERLPTEYPFVVIAWVLL